MSSVQHPLSRWRSGDKKILLIFASYGLAAGVMTYALNLFKNTTLDYFVLLLNFPALTILLYTEWNVANPAGLSILFHPAMLVAGSVAAWSFIGFLLYLLVRMFRMGP